MASKSNGNKDTLCLETIRYARCCDPVDVVIKETAVYRYGHVRRVRLAHVRHEHRTAHTPVHVFECLYRELEGLHTVR